MSKQSKNYPTNFTAKKLLYLCGTLLWLANTSCSIFGGGNEIQRAKGYHVASPKNWEPQNTDGESDQAYRLKSGAIATVTSSCNRDHKVPLEVLTKHLLIGARNIVYEKKERISVSGQEGLFSDVRATLDGTAFNLQLFVIPKGKCVFDFSLVNPKSISPSETQEFLTFVKSFDYGTN